jgi:hypothetical protein
MCYGHWDFGAFLWLIAIGQGVAFSSVDWYRQRELAADRVAFAHMLKLGAARADIERVVRAKHVPPWLRCGWLGTANRTRVRECQNFFTLTPRRIQQCEDGFDPRNCVSPVDRFLWAALYISTAAHVTIPHNTRVWLLCNGLGLVVLAFLTHGPFLPPELRAAAAHWERFRKHAGGNTTPVE